MGSAACLLVFMLCCLLVLVDQSSGGQIENVESPPPQYHWVSNGRVEGHLALSYSPSGAFSPDGSQLAIANGGKVALMNLEAADLSTVLNTPELALQWDVAKDALIGKVHGVNTGGGFGPARWFPEIHYLGLNKQDTFELWNPSSGKGGRIVIPPLTRSANLFTFSPDGRWLLLAQIEASSKTNPIVVQRVDNKFVNILEGHTGAVLSMIFSHDSSKVVTACEDGKVRIFSAPNWKLLHTLAGHDGVVHWAEFSPNGQWIASAGEDKTVRIWSVATGELVQTLQESDAPVLTVAFSPNSEYVAATTEQTVRVWKRVPGGL